MTAASVFDRRLLHDIPSVYTNC